VAWVDAAHVGERESRACRSDQRGRGSLPAHAPDPWCASHGWHELPSRGPAAPVA
jgi:hypothetical protein